MPKKNPETPPTETVLLKPTSDVFIATLFSAPKNEPILLGLINAVLLNSGWPPVLTAKVQNPFNIKEFPTDKRIVLDVRVEDETGQKYNIEVQTTPQTAFQERILFGWADSYSMQIHAGKDYVELRPVFCIVITEFDIFPTAEGVHLVFEARERSDHNLLLSKQLQIHFLRLYDLLQGRLKSLESVSASLKHWLLFLTFGGVTGEKEMSKLVENDPLVMEAQGELRRFSSDPKVQDYLRRRRLAELDYQMGIREALREGKAEGLAEGEARGKAEGEAKGKAETVLMILTHRLGTIPKPLEAKLYSITDLEKLGNLVDFALDTSSLAEFEAEIG